MAPNPMNFIGFPPEIEHCRRCSYKPRVDHEPYTNLNADGQSALGKTLKREPYRNLRIYWPSGSCFEKVLIGIEP